MSQKQISTKVNKEAGFMGLEGMGALLFYLVMLAGAALLIVQLFSGGKLSEMEKALSSLRMGIQQLYIAQGNYDDSTMTATVANAGILPKGFVEGDTINTPWDTDITVAPEGTDKDKFTITVVTPKDDCVKLATYELDAWLDIQVGGSSIIGVEDTGSVSAAQAQCKKATTDEVSIAFTAK